MRGMALGVAGLCVAAATTAQPAVDLCGEDSGIRRQVVSVNHGVTGAPLATWSSPVGRSGQTVTVPDGRRITFYVEPVDENYYRERRDQLPMPEMVRIEMFDASKSMREPIHTGFAGATTVDRYPELGVTVTLARPVCIHEISAAD